MATKDLKSAFDAMYHGKHDFSDFATGDISEKYKRLDLTNKNIYTADTKLKIYHKFLNLFIFQWMHFNKNCVYSYRKGMNVASAVEKHAHSRHFFQTDLNDFFGSLGTPLIQKTLCESLDLLPVTDAENYINRIIELCTVDNKLPIGFSTSPLISNSCLFHFDNDLEYYCKNNELIYTRYSDDIIISGSEGKLYGVGKVVEGMLAHHYDTSLSINTTKTKYSSIGNRVKILGMTILPNGMLTIDAKLKAEIEVLLHFYIKDKQKFLDKIQTDSASALIKLSGYLNYINTVDQNYLNKLRKKYGASVIDMFVRGSVKFL
ncbi:reverse transcriptase domain-containing protein [Pseudomonas sp. EA_15y_Pfl1_P104]|uniref:reverse transcriptase domain-containing protein n=1 Tax=Pseudomonas sp. EA_15y_Pfl1_P104 TaxID=3088686 RepID=UPI0030DCFA20